MLGSAACGASHYIYSHNILLWVSLTSGASEWSSLLDFHFRGPPVKRMLLLFYCYSPFVIFVIFCRSGRSGRSPSSRRVAFFLFPQNSKFKICAPQRANFELWILRSTVGRSSSVVVSSSCRRRVVVVSIHPSIHSSIHPSIHSFIHPSIHSSIHSSIQTMPVNKPNFWNIRNPRDSQIQSAVS